MENYAEVLFKTEIKTTEGTYSLTLEKENLSRIYPNMFRYTVSVSIGGQPVAVFRTNSYEYSPTVPLEAEQVARGKAEAWAKDLATHPEGFIESHQIRGKKPHVPQNVNVMVIQGSPRADGNCSILATWCVDAVRGMGKTVQVVYPHDMDIKSCIGCYQCYNTGTCIFEDDMGGIIDALRQSSLIVICTPVYTNSVPGALKLVIDRCLAYHAERTLAGGRHGQKGLLLSVAGRKGRSNFTCITHVVTAFLRNLEIKPCREILIDRLDEYRDVRTITGLEERVRAAVRGCLAP